MKLGFALFGLIILGLLFEVSEAYEKRWFPPDGTGIFFISLNYPMHFSSIVYYVIETITYIFMGVIIWFRPAVNHFIKAFVVVEFLDLVDFLFTGNTMWFRFHAAPITFNVIKVFIFGSVLAYEFIRNFIASHKLT